MHFIQQLQPTNSYSQPLEATDSWAQYNIDIGNVNAVVFLDLKKTFDTVDRDILLSKLGSVQTSNFSCAESNANEQNLLFFLISIRFGT